MPLECTSLGAILEDDNGEEFTVVHMLRSQEMPLSLLKWHHVKTCKVFGLSSFWERNWECHD